VTTLAEKRAWLRDNTVEEIPSRGRLRPDLEALYDRAHPADTIGDIPDDDPDWDLDGDGDMAGADDLEPSVPMQPERPPRTARTARAATRATSRTTRTDRWVGKLLGDGKATPKGSGVKGKKAPPRVPVEKFTTRMYTSLGRMVSSIAPATGNCLQAQAAMAGVILEDTVRGTFVDKILQPAARAEDKLDKISALVLPPVVVFAMEQNHAAVAAGARTPAQGMMRETFLMPILREGLRVGMEVSEAYADQIKARLERNVAQESEIDKLIAVIFGQVTATAEDVPEPQMAGAAV
jgi:hypothetical protein